MIHEEPRHMYVTDENLMKCLKSLGFPPIERGVNISTNEYYWKYDCTNEISDIVIPWDTENQLQKYSLDRWQLSNSETE